MINTQLSDKITSSILIVDDNLTNLQILADILRKKKYRVAMVKDSFKAFGFIKKKIPDLILLDVMMPGIDGFEMCHQLKAENNTRDIPIIFISGLTDINSKIKGFEAGCVDYITKPFQEKDVLARISAHLNIQNLQKHLWEKNTQLQREISERKRTETELCKAKASLETANQMLEQRVQEELKKRLKQQALLIQKSKLESLGKLAAGIAHEINQPLAAISMGLDNILFKLSSSDNKVTPEYLTNKIDQFSRDIDRINRIISHIRTFSREQSAVLFENVDVNEVCRNVLLMMETQYKNHQVNVTLDLKAGVKFALGNKYKLEQVVLNLLSNAKDAVDEKYDTTDDFSYKKQIMIKTFCDKEYVCLEIKDNGIGISDKHQENIFDPFFTTKSPEHGTGLGLSISYGIVKEMKGEIFVESKFNEYTVMRICLPRVDYELSAELKDA